MGKLAPVVEIDLDRPRTLKLDLNAMCDIEDYNRTHSEASNLDKLRYSLWAALRHEDGTLTIEQVGAMINPSNLNLADSALATLFRSDDSGVDSAVPKAPRRSTGRRSGQ